MILCAIPGRPPLIGPWLLEQWCTLGRACSLWDFWPTLHCVGAFCVSTRVPPFAVGLTGEFECTRKRAAQHPGGGQKRESKFGGATHGAIYSATPHGAIYGATHRTTYGATNWLEGTAKVVDLIDVCFSSCHAHSSSFSFRARISTSCGPVGRV